MLHGAILLDPIRQQRLVLALAIESKLKSRALFAYSRHTITVRGASVFLIEELNIILISRSKTQSY